MSWVVPVRCTKRGDSGAFHRADRNPVRLDQRRDLTASSTCAKVSRSALVPYSAEQMYALVEDVVPTRIFCRGARVRRCTQETRDHRGVARAAARRHQKNHSGLETRCSPASRWDCTGWRPVPASCRRLAISSNWVKTVARCRWSSHSNSKIGH